MHKVTLYGEPKGRVIAVMVVYNGMEFLQAGIESTLAELGSDNSLLVVDNNSSDGSFEFVREKFPQVCVLQTHENLGGAGGFSAGIDVARNIPGTQYIWLLDNDIVAEENSLQPLINCLDKNSNAAAAGSQICLYKEPTIIQEVGAHYTDWLGDIRGGHRGEQRLSDTEPFEVGYTAACSTLIRADVVKKIGGFADIFIFYDDVDWCRRAIESGHSIWAVPQSVIRHNFSDNQRIVPWREYYRKRNRAYCLLAHPPKRLGKFALALYIYYINYLVIFNRLLQRSALAETYGRAKRDFISGELPLLKPESFPQLESDEITGTQPKSKLMRALNSCASLTLALVAFIPDVFASRALDADSIATPQRFEVHQ